MGNARFGWYGFSFEHPDDWAPVALTGNRREGYARLDSGGRQGFQCRWQTVRKEPDLRAVLGNYMLRLEREAKRKKLSLHSDVDESGPVLTYRWTTDQQGRGALFRRPECGRVFFLEAVGGKKDALLPAFRGLVDSFSSTPKKQPELWGLFGLAVKLPWGLQVLKRQFRAGHVRMVLKARYATVEVERWGFAEQLLAKHELGAWSKVAARMSKAEPVLEEEGVRLSGRQFGVPVHALVAPDLERNQIQIVRTAAFGRKWRPGWDWLT